jgi:biotin synthesis protein BioG
MKYHWIQQQHKPGLILFFNGWGMDQHIVQHLQADGEQDVLMLYDYRDLSLDASVPAAMDAYDDISVIAWSMGVWAYERIYTQLRPTIRRAIAINGSGRPVHKKYGIDPSIYQATIDHFSEQGKQKFFKRMCISRDSFEQFQACRPQRTLTEQQAELVAIQQQSTMQHSGAQEALVPYFDRALISRQDRIIPGESQRHYWEGTTKYTYIDAPHFPFFLWKSWNAILDYAADHS